MLRRILRKIFGVDVGSIQFNEILDEIIDGLLDAIERGRGVRGLPENSKESTAERRGSA